MLCGGLPGKDPDGWLTHFAAQQKLAQQCKATALQQKLTQEPSAGSPHVVVTGCRSILMRAVEGSLCHSLKL